jgi:hypothetical protein
MDLKAFSSASYVIGANRKQLYPKRPYDDWFHVGWASRSLYFYEQYVMVSVLGTST